MDADKDVAEGARQAMFVMDEMEQEFLRVCAFGCQFAPNNVQFVTNLVYM